ncbi:branched-chain amino acid transport system substrate-binding protein [Actinoplanes campanulatus]|uniref:Branched-chain amino acid transport system substrate-binding protein n=1 Tax=Actinoplanes campanulatus TaxID=113559 RepID=A0A7W5FCU7_9ACTN|nr:branched-chain amino acid ABC transporter substrate-binding protein [Actinoplanes campanulatus]MBB3093610.1 branched-chain amino acid transport system substrate-binding protein [Actinoplanes campanulatus]GGN04483.1 putative ABC transporter/extracellular ligand-binding receptor [Actinoplanes campanulatus]GID35315.1 putative ABC transporter/extracellular ligand-binding receptor [Actinoplanes campanulatus]
MRRNYVRALGAVGLATAMLAAAGCQDSGGSTTDASGSSCGKIAIFGAFTGPNAGLVLPSLNGAKMAVKQHNAANPDCQVTLQEFDTQGNADQATPIANQVAQDQSFTSVIGGHFSGESKATMPIYEAAGLVMVSPSATAAELTKAGNKSFHRVVGNDSTQAAAAVTYIKDTLKSQKVFLIDDGQTYGVGIIGEVKTGLGALAVNSDKVQTDQQNFDATISKIKSSGADLIAYGGYTNEAAPLLKQARAAGVTAKFLGFDGLYDPGFPAGAGEAAVGAIVTCPCLPAAEAGGTFSADYQKEFGQAPGSYGAEGYDGATILLEGYKAGKKTRADLLAWVDAYDKQGVSKYLKFDETGDVDKSKVVIWSYEVKAGGAIEPLSEIKLS